MSDAPQTAAVIVVLAPGDVATALAARPGDGGAASVDGPDAVQRLRIGDRVAVDGEDVGVEAGRDASLPVSQSAHARPAA